MITPQDIAEKEFRMSFRGYNTRDVDEFLQELYDCFEEIYATNNDLKEKTGRLSDAIGQYKSMEDTLSSALNLAGKSADEIEDCAKSKAEEIIRNAELTAQSIIAGAEQKIRAEEDRLKRVKHETQVYKEKIVQLLNAQLCVLQEYPDNTADNGEDTATVDMTDNDNTGDNINNDNIPDDIDTTTDININNVIESDIDTDDTDIENISDTDNANSDSLKNANDNIKDSECAQDSDTTNNTSQDNTDDMPDIDSDVSDDTVILQKIDNALKGDTSTLPFVAQDENGGYVVHNR